jgi:hypothetical protein
MVDAGGGVWSCAIAVPPRSAATATAVMPRTGSFMVFVIPW